MAEFPKLAMNVITSLAFSERFNTWSTPNDSATIEAEKLGDMVRFMFYFLRPTNPAVSFYFLSKLPGANLRQYETACWGVRAFLDGILKQRLDDMNNGSGVEDCFLDIMLRARKADENGEFAEVDERSMITTMLDFLLAGTDSTSNSSASLIRHLANDLTLQKRLHDELDAAVGRDHLLSIADLDKLPLLDACILEQMRIWPVAPLTLAHVITEDFELRGYKLKKGVR